MRNKFHIICEGDNLPPAVMDFADARLPASILKLLESKGIKRPTPIQMQVGQVDIYCCTCDGNSFLV